LVVIGSIGGDWSGRTMNRNDLMDDTTSQEFPSCRICDRDFAPNAEEIPFVCNECTARNAYAYSTTRQIDYAMALLKRGKYQTRRMNDAYAGLGAHPTERNQSAGAWLASMERWRIATIIRLLERILGVVSRVKL
jgi:hypothetical protein